MEKLGFGPPSSGSQPSRDALDDPLQPKSLIKNSEIDAAAAHKSTANHPKEKIQKSQTVAKQDIVMQNKPK